MQASHIPTQTRVGVNCSPDEQSTMKEIHLSGRNDSQKQQTSTKMLNTILEYERLL
mgnify:CR=1 FL=1